MSGETTGASHSAVAMRRLPICFRYGYFVSEGEDERERRGRDDWTGPACPKSRAGARTSQWDKASLTEGEGGGDGEGKCEGQSVESKCVCEKTGSQGQGQGKPAEHEGEGEGESESECETGR